MKLLTMQMLQKIQTEWCDIFRSLSKTIANNLLIATLATMKAASSNTAEIARQMASFTDREFNTNDVRLRRLIDNERFQIDHGTWRCYFRLLMNILQEKGLITLGQLIPINVDFTTIEDRFLVLSASIPFAGRAIPLYFSMRNYPKKDGQYDHKRMENAFLRELRKLLSKKYRYVIVTDRGFGNVRWMQACQKAGFDYLTRIQGNWKVLTEGGKHFYPSELQRRNYNYQEVTLAKSDFRTRLVISHNGESEGWFLLTSIEEADFNEVVNLYTDHFKIEKMFQDLKSSGFCIENSKILKYSHFKRILFISVISQALMLFVGDWLNDNGDEIKKKYPIHTGLISALSSWL